MKKVGKTVPRHIDREAWEEQEKKYCKNHDMTFADWEARGRPVCVFLAGRIPKVPRPTWMTIPSHVAEQMFWLCYSPSGNPRVVSKDWMSTRDLLRILFKNLRG